MVDDDWANLVLQSLGRIEKRLDTMSENTTERVAGCIKTFATKKELRWTAFTLLVATIFGLVLVANHPDAIPDIIDSVGKIF